MSERIEIEGIRRPARRQAAVNSTPRIGPIVRPRHFVWLAVIGGLALGVGIWGTPHLLYKYTYYVPRGKSLSFSSRYYESCTYVGWTIQRLTPNDGKCPIIKLLKAAPEER